MSNGTPEEKVLYVVAQDNGLIEFQDKATALIREGFEPLGTLTTSQTGAIVTYLQAFWRPDEAHFKT